ncbi:MAG: acyl carrier protein [Bacteroidetes bacterium]|nr:acyl carrier protein [Bacteroidota bacterium]
MEKGNNQNSNEFSFFNIFHSYITTALKEKLELFGIKSEEVKGDFDLVKSGLMDSMSFVDFIGDMERHFGKEIDFDKVMDDENFTTLDGLIKLFQDERS